ncbi:hypothetical protein HRG_007816 [Hirsutella rhossiliensis]|uniref:GPI-anchored protein n=1 Tax=Hirsutella rhossiliensis TaxID=111463 RepID=A0A9P8SF93_9HYPO|nr:uncharacterized protein HRG_07816 [Hirsutella rhossiliensis]KAH0960663.1 hypothetical protein HRG_07816 [Hirsutella rhossiliensis]
MGGWCEVFRFLLVAVLAWACTASQAAAPTTYVPAATPALAARAQCPANTFPCPTSLGAAFNDICCQNGQTCALDANNSPACCPAGAVCTGTAPATPLDSVPTAAVSYVPNSYFSFPYAATTFANSASCASAVAACSSNYGVCVAGLQRNGGYAVTINVPGGGGTTVGGMQGDLGASATPICSSLSSQACSRLGATKCESFGQRSGESAARLRLSPMLALLAGVGVVFFTTFPDARL